MTRPGVGTSEIFLDQIWIGMLAKNFIGSESDRSAFKKYRSGQLRLTKNCIE